MYTLRILIIVAAGIFLPVLSTAQPVWTLERCFDHALSNNLQIKQQQFAEERTRNDLRQSYANLFPNLNAYSQQGYNYGRTIDPFTNDFATERVAFQRLYGSSNVTLFSGFQNINNIRMHLAQNTAFRYDTERLQNDILLSIASAYLQILYFEDMVEVTRQQLEVMEQQVERSSIMMEGGTIARGAMLEIEAQAAQERLNLLNMENNLNLAYLELIHMLDLDPGEPFTIEQPELEVGEEYLFQDPAVVLEKALGIEPSVMAAGQRIRMAQSGLAMARGEQSPRISFGASYGSGYSGLTRRQVGSEATGQFTEIGRTASNEAVLRELTMPIYEKVSYRDQIKENMGGSLQLELYIPIFNRLQTRRRIQNSRIDLETARVGYEITRNDLMKTIEQAHADATAAYQRYLATTKSQEAFRESFKDSEQRFNLGMISSVEYNEAKARLARSEADALQAKYEYIFSARILEFYQGRGFNL
jgi:outer membrane protein